MTPIVSMLEASADTGVWAPSLLFEVEESESGGGAKDGTAILNTGCAEGVELRLSMCSKGLPTLFESGVRPLFRSLLITVFIVANLCPSAVVGILKVGVWFPIEFDGLTSI